MKKSICSIFLLIIVFANSYGQKTVTGKFATHDTTDKVYYSVLQTISASGFVVKSSDKQQGMIQAEQGVGGFGSGQIFATMFVLIRKENEKSIVSATFTRNPGFMGGDKPEQLAQKFSNELNKTFGDLEIGMDGGGTPKTAAQHLSLPPTNQQMSQDLVGQTFGDWSVNALEEVNKFVRVNEIQLGDQIRYKVEVTLVKKRVGPDPRKNIKGYITYKKDDKGLWVFSKFDQE